MTLKEWQAEAEKRYGPDPMKWRFVCPACKHVASIADYKAAGAPEGAVAFSCVGRWHGGCREAFDTAGRPGPCNYAGGGLFGLNPVAIDDRSNVFDFDAEPLVVDSGVR